ncbi:hypothetical protein [Staphylococcus hominis]|uniref:hypothetical protein n=1 Tax=Staphylococcus hominis TaxID=1290 RepID=UPI00019FC37E|nr:hypothetical protein [Staphylococcus hominis]EEK12730.1 hypothetical protein STAHO0001_1355 [Staphylococcus hominis SK119]MCI2859316.1 hypothetical protein [Staphylococcus hominis]MDS3855007.1 hypothetical protein [Staphylococcus hominis]MDS3882264.1 hypothetical protein [Staphylococcus hominis]QKH81923.1 hypothetical protein FOC68_06575 [Staphylococcus hominis]
MNKNKLKKKSINDVRLISNLFILLVISLLNILFYLTLNLDNFAIMTTITYMVFIGHFIFINRIKLSVNLNNISPFQFFLIEFGFCISGFTYLISMIFLLFTLAFNRNSIFDYITVISFVILVFLEGVFPKTIKRGIEIDYYIIDINNQNDVKKMYTDYTIFNIIGLIIVATTILIVTIIKFLNDFPF